MPITIVLSRGGRPRRVRLGPLVERYKNPELYLESGLFPVYTECKYVCTVLLLAESACLKGFGGFLKLFSYRKIFLSLIFILHTIFQSVKKALKLRKLAILNQKWVRWPLEVR